MRRKTEVPEVPEILLDSLKNMLKFFLGTPSRQDIDDANIVKLRSVDGSHSPMISLEKGSMRSFWRT